jgi:hypothetical protein
MADLFPYLVPTQFQELIFFPHNHNILKYRLSKYTRCGGGGREWWRLVTQQAELGKMWTVRENCKEFKMYRKRKVIRTKIHQICKLPNLCGNQLIWGEVSNSWILNDIGRNFLLGNRRKIAKFSMSTFTYRSTFLYGLNLQVMSELRDFTVGTRKENSLTVYYIFLITKIVHHTPVSALPSYYTLDTPLNAHVILKYLKGYQINRIQILYLKETNEVD